MKVENQPSFSLTSLFCETQHEMNSPLVSLYKNSNSHSFTSFEMKKHQLSTSGYNFSNWLLKSKQLKS